MRALDLFCGLGGWSDGLAAEGFDVLGVEIEPEIAALYKHPVIVKDVCELDPEEFKGYDLIVGSPPCREFTHLGITAGRNKWKIPQDPQRGLILINAFFNFVEIAEPRYWLMENVPRAAKFIDMIPRVKTLLANNKWRCFWGNYPLFLVPRALGHPKHSDRGRLRSWYNAIIPFPVARALGRAVREAIK